MSRSSAPVGPPPPNSLSRLGKYWLFVRVFFWTQAVSLLLRTVSLPRLLRILTPEVEPSALTPELLEHGCRINSYVFRTLRQNPDNLGKMCLRRSLVLYRFLRLCGIPAVFRVGVKKEDGELIGHSWIEIHGEHFLDSQPDIEYRVTFSYPRE